MQLRTLGGLELEGVAFGRIKPLLLLCYLTIEGRRERRFLADLFWPHAASPRTSLSVALSQLRKGAPGSIITTNRHAEAAILSDAASMLRALEQGDLTAGIERYHGMFLDGVELPGIGAELSEWLLVTREFLAARVRDALLELGTEAAAAGDFTEAGRYAATAWNLPGAGAAEPDELPRLYALLAAAKHPLRRYVERDAAELGMTLTLDADAARAELMPARSASAWQLPQPGSPLVGRDPELAELTELLRKPEVRVVTLTGPGGIGKSRLALQVARALARERSFADGVCFVPLEAAASAEQVPAALATALQLPTADLDALISWLATRRILLLLDNLEHLPAATPLLEQLLEQCPDLTVLATSRTRLGLEAEWTLPLEGLSYPPDDTDIPPPAAHGTDLDAGYYDAVRLFVQRAKRARLTFHLDTDNLPDVLEICRLTGGSPLGLELAAAWVRALSCRDIAQEIARNADFLTREQHAGAGATTAATATEADKHRSMRAVFEHSWRLLSAPEQQALQALAVFAGGFRKEAATAIADLSIPLLAALTDASLLQRLPGGRYRLHPLLQQHAQEKLALRPDLAKELEQRHASYYLELLAQQAEALRGKAQRQAAALLGEELENLRLAWHRALTLGDIDLLARAAGPLAFFYVLRGQPQEGEAAFGSAIAAVRPHAKAAPAVLGRLLLEQARFVMRLGRYQQAYQHCEEALELLRAASAAITPALDMLGVVSFYLGAYRQARAWTEEVAAAARADGDDHTLARALGHLAVIEQSEGDYPAAERRYRESMALYRTVGNEAAELHTMANLGSLLLNSGHLDGARAMTKEALERSRASGYHDRLPLLLHNLAICELKRGAHDDAEALVEEALELTRRRGEQPLEAGMLATLGRIATARRAFAHAERRLAKSLRLAWSLGDQATSLTALLWLGELQLERDQPHEAARLLRLVYAHPATLQWARAAAEQLLTRCDGKVTDDLQSEGNVPGTGPEHALRQLVLEVLGRNPIATDAG